MSTQILTATGKTIAIKYCGGKVPGISLDLLVPQNLMIDIGGMRVHEKDSHTVLELEDYIAEQAARGARINYREPSVHGFNVISAPRSRESKKTRQNSYWNR